MDPQEAKEIQENAREMLYRYGLPALMGFWDNSKALLEEKTLIAEKKRERCELFLQKKHIALIHLMFEVDITMYNKHVLYGVPIQIQTEEQKDVPEDMVVIPPMLLSTIITEKQIGEDNILVLCKGCIMTATPDIKRLRRNVFVIVSAATQKPKKKGEEVLYNDDIYICLYNTGTERKLYIQCEVPDFDHFGGENEHYPLCLTDNPNRYCKFRIVYREERERLFKAGSVVFSNERICFQHTLSNRLLAVEPNKMITTLIGEEFLVSCFTFKDARKQITAENYWVVITKKIGEDVDNPGPSPDDDF